MDFFNNFKQDRMVKPQHVETGEAVAASEEQPQTYTRPVLKVGSENPSGKLSGNACCGHC